MNKKKETLTKVGSTIFLRVAVFGMGAVALLLCYLILPAINEGWAYDYPEIADWRYLFMALLAATIVPFFIALYQTLKLLHYVDKNKAFSELSVKALRYITYCAFAFGALYAASLPFIYHVADRTDAPGVMVIGLVMTFAPMVVGVFAAVLRMLLQSAIAIKSENDLTV